MLYPKNREAKLSEELFRNPTSEYRAAPFWSWNCKLEEEELLWQLEMLKKMGMGGAHMHVRTGMQTQYLSDEHMALVKACVEKCKEENMLAWLYDEDRWPSGAAGGYVTKDEKHRIRYLMFTVKPYSDGKAELSNVRQGDMERSENGELLACYDIILDENGCLAGSKRIGENDPAEGTKWYVYAESPAPSPWFNYQTYVDTLSKDAMKQFIDVTYERYLEAVGSDFGGTVPAIFTDEPQHALAKRMGFAKDRKDIFLPWSDDLPKTYTEAYGEDILENLPHLLWELPDGQVSPTRYRYHDHVTERFATAFADQCGAWCREHGLMLTGHMMAEMTLKGQTAYIGEAMRHYRGFTLPGIDMLNNKVELSTAKQCQSAVHQQGAEGMMSELYGVTGWSFDFRGHKFQGDWQAALGVTLRVPHLAWVSMKGEAKRDYPAAIGYQSPWWKDYTVVEDHFARVATAMSRGKPVVRVAVVHPSESYWLHYGPDEQTGQLRDRMEEEFQALIRWLLGGSIDFDFICEANLPGQCQTGGAPLQVGKMAYDAVIVPGCETLRSTTLERLEGFREAGGKLIFLGDAPKYEDALPSNRGAALWEKSEKVDYSRDAVLNALEDIRLLDIRDATGSRTTELVHQLRRDGDDLWLFVAHSVMPQKWEVPVPKQLRITLEGSYRVQKYDTQTGNIEDVGAVSQKGRTVVKTVLYDSDSLLLRFAPGEPVKLPEEKTKAMWQRLTVPKLAEVILEEPNVYLLDKAQYALDDAPYAPEEELLRADEKLRLSLGWHKRNGTLAQPWVIPEEPVVHQVRLRFTVPCAQSFENIKLALEDADVARIFLNGKKVENQPDGWYVDKSIGTVLLGTLPEGENTIEVILPFGKRTNVEWCYLLGDFDVAVRGEYRQLIRANRCLGFDDLAMQGLAHYGGNLTYKLPMKTNGGDLRITVPHYAGAALKVRLAGQEGYIIYAPYQYIFKNVPAGEHTLELTLLGHRYNSFGPVHMTETDNPGSAPKRWRTEDAGWTESYRFKPMGILSAPSIELRMEN